MKKYDNFIKCFSILENSKIEKTAESEIYRTGVIGQFNLTFELAWKALQEVLRAHRAEGAETGSPREILKLGYKVGFLSNDEVWLSMLNSRNASIHVYDEEEVNELIKRIYCEFIPEFSRLRDTLKEKIDEAEEKSWK